ncbi:hypothetical protein BDW22DRAFT_952635 [Trametopsis cervina]|nr:hypothetical protein BDW22DRAFT_952635 [Trametopsis cervina]
MKDRAKQQAELHDLIVKVFRKRRRLSYFQGYHDIISVLFLTLPQKLQLPCAEKLSLHRVRDSMGASLEPVVGLVLQRLLSLADDAYASLLAENAPLPYFALSNLLTLFAHDMPTLPLIQHVFDYLLCRPPIMTVYLAAALILARKLEVERLQQEGEEGMMHSLLSGLPDLFDEDDPPREDLQDAEDGDRDVLCSTSNNQPVPVEGDREDAGRNTPHVLSSTLEANRSLDEEWVISSPGATTLVEVSVNGDSIEEEPPSLPSQNVSVAPELDVQPSEDLPDSPAQATPDQSPPEIEDHIEVGSSTSSLSLPGHLRPHEDGSSSSEHAPRSRVSLSSLLERADELYLLYPPSHPSMNLPSIMGPQSVMLTWSENPSQLPSDDDAELMVTQPHLIVLPPPEEDDTKEKMEETKDAHGAAKRRRRTLRKPVRIGSVVIKQRTVVASAVLVLGVAMAVYGLQASTPDRHHGASRELKKLTRFVGGLVLGVGGKLWERLIDH